MNNTQCEFCNVETRSNQQVCSNDLAIVLYPKNPLIIDHFIIISKRHIEMYSDLTDMEILAVHNLINKLHDIVGYQHSMDGYNVMINNGDSAGQHVSHSHIHIFFRSAQEEVSPFDILSKKAQKNYFSREQWNLLIQDFRSILLN